MKPIIGAQLFTVRANTKTEEDIAQTLRRIREMGYRNVQISAFGPYRTAFLREELEKNGLTVCATHTAYERLIGETDAVIAEHLELGIPYVGLGMRKFATEEDVHVFLREILPVARKIRESGLQFVYHNHHHEFAPLDTGRTPMEIILENTEPEEFGLLIDVHWLMAAGVSPTSFMRRNADRINVIHLKDFALDSERNRIFAAIGEGNMDFEEILSVAEEIGVKYAAVEQDNCYGEDPFTCLARSLAYLRGLGYDL